MDADCYIVVDVLRATTTIATLFAGGMESLLVAGDIELARDWAKSDGRLLFGEVGGLRPEGFDFGNSPVEASRAAVVGRHGVLFTTNGTAALCGLADRGNVAAGALANVTAVAQFASRFDRVVVACAGNANGEVFSEEDYAAARAIAARIAELDPGRQPPDPTFGASGLDASAVISNAPHAELLRKLGLAEDIEFCVGRDTSLAVPAVVESGDGWALLRDASKPRS